MISLDNLCNNFNKVTVNYASFYFSYKTIVAFAVYQKFYVSENIWSRTTGKHLNMLCEKKERINHSEFKKILETILNNI